jgi:signal transduction histidine kinase
VSPALLFSEAVRSLPVAIFTVTSDGLVIGANATAMKTAGLSRLQPGLELTAIVDCPREQLLAHLRSWSRSRSHVPGKLIWRTPEGPKPRKLSAWCARPGTASEPAVVILRCESEGDRRSRFAALNDQIDVLRKEVRARQEIEAGLADTIASRDAFVAIAAHELRNPLNVFQLTLQLLYRLSDASAPAPPTDIRGLLRKLKVQLDRITSLVERLLDVGRIRAGMLQLEREAINLADLVREVSNRFLDLHPDLPLSLQVQSEVNGNWDRLRLDQTISNIVSNAFKYGLRKPIEITVGTRDDFAFVSVEDHGIGVMPDDIERIFDRFERAVPPSNIEGLGLGLWIAKRIVEAHGGTIEASGRPGHGATFTVRLPVT